MIKKSCKWKSNNFLQKKKMKECNNFINYYYFNYLMLIIIKKCIVEMYNKLNKRDSNIHNINLMI